MIDKADDDSDEEGEDNSEVYELIHRSQSMSNVLYQGAEHDQSQVSFNADDSRAILVQDQQASSILDNTMTHRFRQMGTERQLVEKDPSQ